MSVKGLQPPSQRPAPHPRPPLPPTTTQAKWRLFRYIFTPFESKNMILFASFYCKQTGVDLKESLYLSIELFLSAQKFIIKTVLIY